jgi:hypothetical protein
MKLIKKLFELANKYAEKATRFENEYMSGL